MEVIAPSGDVVTVLRAISRAGFGYQPTKKLAQAAGWKLVDDEFDLGFVAFEMPLGSTNEVRRLAVEVSESGRSRLAFVALFSYEEYEVQWEPLDEAYQSLCQQMANVIGPPSASGEFRYSHRPGWLYSCCWWPLSDTTLILTQDEFDIQFGMDVTLWIMPAGTTVEIPVSTTLSP